jgi:hypothetical protein
VAQDILLDILDILATAEIQVLILLLHTAEDMVKDILETLQVKQLAEALEVLERD